MNPLDRTKIMLDTARALGEKGLKNYANNLLDDVGAYASAANINITSQKEEIVNVMNNIKEYDISKSRSIDEVLSLQQLDVLPKWALTNNVAKNMYSTALINLEDKIKPQLKNSYLN